MIFNTFADVSTREPSFNNLHASQPITHVANMFTSIYMHSVLPEETRTSRFNICVSLGQIRLNRLFQQQETCRVLHNISQKGKTFVSDAILPVTERMVVYTIGNVNMECGKRPGYDTN